MTKKIAQTNYDKEVIKKKHLKIAEKKKRVKENNSYLASILLILDSESLTVLKNSQLDDQLKKFCCMDGFKVPMKSLLKNKASKLSALTDCITDYKNKRDTLESSEGNCCNVLTEKLQNFDWKANEDILMADSDLDMDSVYWIFT